ncbi:hypothetical protein TIFTF001_024993 [Ficus carica]|uniref:Cation efflux protein transmembrane domain-containing protein n=1 Tax=Ficus carica TaxID=3494 RepID=A0AA88AWA9_FICCA|nr:hypothetical protein TIFTF001_024993 [Ficus carica]
MEKENSFNYRARPDSELQSSFNGDFGLGVSDRRFAFSRQASFQQYHEPRTPISNSLKNDNYARLYLLRTVSSIDIPLPESDAGEESVKLFGEREVSGKKFSVLLLVASVFRVMRSGNRYMKRLFMLISLNVAYSTAELCIGLLTGRVGLVSDAFHLTFGCGLLTFSLLAMAASRGKPDGIYTYGYKRLEVLSAFTNAWVYEPLSPSSCKPVLQGHYLIVSAVTNLIVNLIGVWFFRNYARVNLILVVPKKRQISDDASALLCFTYVIHLTYQTYPSFLFHLMLRALVFPVNSQSIYIEAYRKAEDMNYHSVCLHVLADSIRSAGLIFASWLLSLGVQNAEVLCFGLVSVAVFMLVMPLFRATGGILLQMAPPSIPPSALNKCWRQITAHEDASEVSQARFWELVPGHVVGSLSIQVKKGVDDRPILQYVHGLLVSPSSLNNGGIDGQTKAGMSVRQHWWICFLEDLRVSVLSSTDNFPHEPQMHHLFLRHPAGEKQPGVPAISLVIWSVLLCRMYEPIQSLPTWHSSLNGNVARFYVSLKNPFFTSVMHKSSARATPTYYAVPSFPTQSKSCHLLSFLFVAKYEVV